jgi:hypothetical protein
MRFEWLLVLFEHLNRAGVGYTVVGTLATTMHGHAGLGEVLEISVPESVAGLHDIVQRAWPSAWLTAEPTDDVILRAELPASPISCDFVTVPEPLPVEHVYFGGVAIRVTPNSVAKRWPSRERAAIRPGFTFRQRLDAVNALGGVLAPPVDARRGVQKFRSFEALQAEHARTTAARVAP